MNTAVIGLGFLQEQLSVTCSDNTHQETVRDIAYSCDKAMVVLNEVLLWDKLEKGILALELEPLSPYVFVVEVVNPFHIQVT